MPPRATGRCRTRSASVKALRSLRSAPTQNARSWLDRSTTQRTLGSAATRAVASASAVAIGRRDGVEGLGAVEDDLDDVALPVGLDADQRAGVGHRSSCRSGMAAGRRTGVPARVSRNGSTLPTPRKVRGRSGDEGEPGHVVQRLRHRLVDEHAARVGDRGEARGPVDGVAEDVPELGHHPARGQADAHVGQQLVVGDRLDQVDGDGGGRRGVAVGRRGPRRPPS